MRTKLLLVLIIASTASCRMDELNKTPNRPIEVPLNTLLPSAQRNLANITGREVWQYSNLLANQMLGTQLQPQQISQYQIDEVFVGYMYSDIYISVMHNLDIIIRQADANRSPHYAGIARILMTYSLSLLTTFWGDVPFEQGLDRTNTHPVFDPQQQIYSIMDQMLLRAIDNLSQSQSTFTPGGDDLFYAGNRNLWIKAAHTLRARLALHTIKQNPDAPAIALTHLASGITHSQEALVYRYQGTQTDPNPIFIYFQTNPNMVVHPDFRLLLIHLNDPRRLYLLYRKPFTADTIPGLIVSSIGAPFPLISLEEALLLRAEAHCRLGQTAEAQKALTQAIHENCRRIMDTAYSPALVDDYIDAHATLSGITNSDLNLILTQKHIALFTHHEPYTDYRRTGLPDLNPHPGGTNPQNPNGQIPRRLIYPQIERLNNRNFPNPAPNLQTRFWWDQ